MHVREGSVLSRGVRPKSQLDLSQVDLTLRWTIIPMCRIMARMKGVNIGQGLAQCLANRPLIKGIHHYCLYYGYKCKGVVTIPLFVKSEHFLNSCINS